MHPSLCMFFLDKVAIEPLSVFTGKIQLRLCVHVYVLVFLQKHKRLRLLMVRCATNKAFISREFTSPAKI